MLSIAIHGYQNVKMVSDGIMKRGNQGRAVAPILRMGNNRNVG